MNFIVHLPKTRSGFTAILAMVDRLTKMVHFLPTVDTATAKETAALFRDRVFCLHGMPRSVVSDRDVKFISAFLVGAAHTVGNQTEHVHIMSSSNRRSDRVHEWGH